MDVLSPDGGLLRRYEQRAAEEPAAVALRCWSADDGAAASSITRGELAARARDIAARVDAAARGSDGGAPIGLCFCGTTPQAVAAMLAARAAGRPYLPLDASAQAPERMRRLCDAVGCAVLVCDAGSFPLARAVSGAKLPVVCADDTVGAAENRPPPKRVQGGKRDAPLYLMFTSGSTGQPKAVAGTERGAVNRCDWQAKAFPWAPTDVAIARTSLSFVDHVAEIWAPLIAGVPIVVLAHAAGRSPWREPSVLLRTVRDFGVSRLVVVPSLLREMLRLGGLRESAPSLRYLHVSGEPLQMALAEQALRGGGDSLRVLNLYGSTECAADVTCHVLSRDGPRVGLASSSLVPVGSALANCGTLLLQDGSAAGQWTEPAEGQVGEVFVSGAHLAAGYFGDARATSAAFIYLRNVAEGVWAQAAAEEAGAERFFRTGDRGVFVLDTPQQPRTLHLLGRDDQQIKLKGVRINLLEVEAALRAAERVSDVVVCFVTRPEQAIVALVDANCRCSDAKVQEASSVVTRHCAACERELKRDCAARVLTAAVPTAIWFTDSLPRLPNGKADRRTTHRVVQELHAAGHGSVGKQTVAPPPFAFTDADPVRQWARWLHLLWLQQLGMPGGDHEGDDALGLSFFDLGGDSLKAIRMLQAVSVEAKRQRLSRWLGTNAPPLLAPFEADPTPLGLANLVVNGERDGRDPPVARVKPAGNGSVISPLCPSQHASTCTYEVVPLVEADVDEVAALVSREFCSREPLMAWLQLTPRQQSWFERETRSFCKKCVRSSGDSSPLSFVAKCSRGHIVAFSINAEVEHWRPGESPGDQLYARFGPACASRLICLASGCCAALSHCSRQPRMPEEYHQHLALYASLFNDWCGWHGRTFAAKQCLHMVYSGAAEPTDSFRSGAAAVRACDEAALASATAQGFDLAYTVCTSPVTHYIAEHELGFRRRVRWDSSKESAQLVVGDRSLPKENNVALYDKLLRAERVDAAEATVLSPPQLQQERQLHEQLQQCMRQAFSTVSPITLRREMRHLSEGDTHAVVLAKAEQSDEVAGGAALVELDDATKGAVEVMLIGVWPEFRGRGCARRLLREIDAVASANAWRLIFLTTKPEKAQMYIEHGYREASAEEAERYEAWKEASTRPTEVVAQFHYQVVTLVKAL